VSSTQPNEFAHDLGISTLLRTRTWLMENRGGVIQNYAIPKNSLKNKHQCGNFLRK
jgi:hypothetical protein